MDRDWMTTGRRPAGLCGAAILIASRYHGFKRNIKEITDVVHVCDETIRRRLEEFSNTTTAKLTKEEFESLDNIKDDGKGRDPPAFIKNRKKEEEELIRNEELVRKAKEIEKIFSDETGMKAIGAVTDDNSTMEQTVTYEKKEIVSGNTITTEAVSITTSTQFESVISNFPIQQAQVQNKIHTISLKPNSAQDKIEIYIKEQDEELSDIEETSLYIVSNEEYKLKKLLWEVLFKDWIDEQKDKKKAEKKEVKKRERKNSKLDSTSMKDPVDAIINSNKFKRMNVNFLNRMFKNNNK